jgi:hypothetical protein
MLVKLLTARAEFALHIINKFQNVGTRQRFVASITPNWQMQLANDTRSCMLLFETFMVGSHVLHYQNQLHSAVSFLCVFHASF